MTEPATDTHAHVHFKGLAEDMLGVLERARAAGVERIINVGTEPAENAGVVETAERETMLYAAVGFHPHEARQIKAVDWPVIEELARREKVVALGEFGLDYHHVHSPRPIQRDVFAEGIRLALDADLPLVIHTRDADEDTLRVLDEAAGGRMPRGVFHCFTGSPVYATEALARGFYISFSGVVTFPNAKQVREAARGVPLERVLVETDAPYCAPAPMRGKTNEPAYLVHVIRFLADLYGLSQDDVRRITTRNAACLFDLPVEARGPCIVYPIRRSLYVNVTDQCTNRCTFCPRSTGNLIVKGHDLYLEREPTTGQILKALKEAEPGRYEEVVFCGFGEPTLRLDVVRLVAKEVRARWGRPTRLDTNGQGSAIAGRDIVPELAEVIDAVSVSLVAPDAETYERACRPTMRNAFQTVCDFVRRSKGRIRKVRVTAVALPGLDVEAVRRFAEDELGVEFSVRTYQVVG